MKTFSIVAFLAGTLAFAAPALAQGVEVQPTQPQAAQPQAAQPQAAQPQAQPAQPQPAPDYSGFWNCQMTYTEYSGPNQRSSGHVKNWGMLLNADKTYGMEGMQPGVGPFYGQGTWEGYVEGVVLKGQEASPPYPPIPGMTYVLKPDGNGGLTQRVETPAYNANYIAQMALYACQRGQQPQRNWN